MSELQISERLQIKTLLKAGHKPAFIAKQLGRNRSTISREISRNTSEYGVYCHDFAQKTRNKRRFDSKESILIDGCNIQAKNQYEKFIRVNDKETLENIF